MNTIKTITIGGKNYYKQNLSGSPKTKMISKKCEVCGRTMFSNYPACSECFKAGKYKPSQWKNRTPSKEQQAKNLEIVKKIRLLKNKMVVKSRLIEKLRKQIK